MPLSDFLLGKPFPKMEPFVEALQQGIDKELIPLKEEIAQLKTLLGDTSAAAAAAAAAAQAAQQAASNAQNTADTAQSTANNAQTAANNPPPPVTVTVTPPVTESTTGGGTSGTTGGETTTGGEQPPSTTPVVTTPVRDQIVGISVEPLAAVATIGQLSGAGSYAVGETATLQFTSPPEGYTFDGWYNATGQRVSTDQVYTFTVVSGGGSFTARFTAISVQPTTVPVSIQWSKAYVGGATGANLTISGNGQTVQNVVSPSTPVSTSLPIGTSVTVSINIAQMGARYAWIDLLNGGTVSNQRSFTFTLNEETRYRCVVSSL